MNLYLSLIMCLYNALNSTDPTTKKDSADRDLKKNKVMDSVFNGRTV